MSRHIPRRVYFIKPAGLDGPIKIGCSAAPEDRLSNFSTWSPFPLEVMGSVPGTLNDERFLHECFAHLHSHREWFRSSPDLRAAIESILKADGVAAVRETLIRTGSIRTEAQKSRNRTEEQKRCYSYKYRVLWASRRLRSNGANVQHGGPQDISNIIWRWQQGESPAPEEIAALDEFIASSNVPPVGLRVVA